MKNCVIWTRVSTKRQEDNGGSLDDQRCKCEEFAKQNGYKIKGYFGGTHESAKTPGPMLKEMYQAIRKDKTITHLIISAVDRFSRSVAQGATIIANLMQLKVVIVEAASGVDSSTREGMMMIHFKLGLAEWDNGNRTDKFTSGRKHCLESGVYCGSAKPLGYDKHGKSMGTTFTINDKGRLIAKAFRWKLQGMANYQILSRLSTFGLDMSKQKLHKILTNPFYAGKIRHKMLDGKLVDGNQPKIISYEDFLRVQEILSGRTGVYKHKKETPRFPLKRHVICSKDHTPFTAYTVNKKNIDYYKCNLNGCKTNVSAKKLHSRYEDVLRFYNIPDALCPILHGVISSMMCSENEEQRKNETLLKKQKTECLNKLKTCKMRFGMGDIDEDVYQTTNEMLQEKLDKIELELAKCRKDLSNLDGDVDEVLSMCCKLDSLWKDSSLETSQKLQNLLFPDGILWDKEKDDYRTFNENEALAVIARVSSSYKNKKEDFPEEKSSKVNLCARRDSNPHASRHQILSLARLPITPRAQCFWVSECKDRQKNGITKLLLSFYPKRKTECFPKIFFVK